MFVINMRHLQANSDYNSNISHKIPILAAVVHSREYVLATFKLTSLLFKLMSLLLGHGCKLIPSQYLGQVLLVGVQMPSSPINVARIPIIIPIL